TVATPLGIAAGTRARGIEDDAAVRRAELHLEPLRLAMQDDGCSAVRVPYQIAEHVVQLEILERHVLRIGEELFDWLGLTGGNLVRRQLVVRAGVHRESPVVARSIGELKVWREADRLRRRL